MSKQLMTVDLVASAMFLFNAGAPTSGTSGTFANYAPPGAVLIDITNKNLYQNTGTLASPTWSQVASNEGNVNITGGAINGTAIGGTTPAAGAFTSVALGNADALAAGVGGTKGAATAMVPGVNRFSTVTTAGDSGLLPPAIPGQIAVVVNDASNGMKIYGAGTDTLNDVATATATWLPGKSTYVFGCSVAGKWYSPLTNAPASSQSQVVGPSTPNSTSVFTMQGLAGAITPTRSGTVLVTISGTITGTSTAAGDGLITQVSYGTGAAPTANAALTGTQVGGVQEYLNPTTVTAADVQVPFSTTAIITGLTPGTAYWLDLAAKAVAHTLTGLSNVNIAAVEIGG